MAVKLKDIVLPNTLVYPKIDTFKLFEIMADAPVKNGLVGSYFLGAKNADPSHNFANPTLPLLRVLNPDETNSSSAKLSKNTGYYNTQIPSTSTMSILVLARQPENGKASPVVSSYLKRSASDVSGDTLLSRWTDNAANVAMYGQGTATSVSNASRTTLVSAGEYHVFGGLISAVPSVGAFEMSETTEPLYSPGALPGRALSGRALLIGASYSADEFLGASEVSAVLIYNTDIGVSSMATMMKWLRNVVGVQAGIWSAPKS